MKKQFIRSYFPLNEVIQLEIQSIKRIIKLNKDVVYFTGTDDWDMIPPGNNRLKCDYGACYPYKGYFIINLNEITTLRQLKNTLAHELLHVRWPKATESQIEKLAREYTNKDGE